MIQRHSERALRGALYLIGIKLMFKPVMVPCLGCFKENNGCIRLTQGSLSATLSISEIDGVKILDITITRHGKTTLWIVLPYVIATCYISSPVTALIPPKHADYQALEDYTTAKHLADLEVISC